MIGLDAGNSFDRPPTGVAVYARNLIWELSHARPQARFEWYLRSNRYFRSYRARLPRNVRRRLLERPALRYRSRRLQLFHGLNQRLPARINARKVATFHDLFALTGAFATADFQTRFASLAAETVSRCDHIIAVSGHTADQVANHLGFPRSRITVIHHGVEALEPPPRPRCDQILRSIGVSRPFVLHIGALQVRKNVGRVIGAFEAARTPGQLVLAGSRGFGAEGILERVERSAVRDRIVLAGHVDDEERAALYNGASALLFPSLEEGFGLPVIEAFSVGLPVVASNVSALPEVAGDAAILVNPLDSDEIARALMRVLEDSELRSTLRRKGLARSKLFTWERCAAETWRVYERLL